MIIIADIEADPFTYEVKYVTTSEQRFLIDQQTGEISWKDSWIYTARRSMSNFESMLAENGGQYTLGRFIGTTIRDPEPIRYATDVIPEYGDQTYYYGGDEIWVYINPNLDPTPTKLYYKKKSASSWNNVNISSLPTKTVNGVTVYNITSQIADYDTYIITTNTTQRSSSARGLATRCTIKRIRPGTVSVANTGEVTLVNHSLNITPKWTVTLKITPGHSVSTNWPAPEGYKADPIESSRKLINGDTFNIDSPTSGTAYYVRVYYDTGFGQAYKDSPIYYL